MQRTEPKPYNSETEGRMPALAVAIAFEDALKNALNQIIGARQQS